MGSFTLSPTPYTIFDRKVPPFGIPSIEKWYPFNIAKNAAIILEHGLVRSPQFGKKIPHKIYIAVSNGAQKNRLKDMYYFF